MATNEKTVYSYEETKKEVPPEYHYPVVSNKRITSITNNIVSTDTLDADHLILGNVTVENITSDPAADDYKTLITARALNKTIISLTEQIQALDPHHVLYEDNSVLTLPVIDSSFSDIYWEWSGWEVVRGVAATYTGNPVNNEINYLKLSNYPFTRHGKYFVSIDVEALDSGALVAYNEGNVEIARTTVPGIWNFIYIPDYSGNYAGASLKVCAKDVFTKELVHISAINAYYLTPRLERYVDYAVPKITSGGSGYASVDYVNRTIEEIQLQLQETLDKALANIPDLGDLSSFIRHINDTITNPHGITPAMIKAAPQVHEHTPEEIGAAPANHTHLPIEIGAAEVIHTHSLESLNAAAAIHTHTPEEIGAATINHEHPEYVTRDELGDLDLGDTGNTRIPDKRIPVLCRQNGNFPSSPLYREDERYPLPVWYPTKLQHSTHGELDPTIGIVSCNYPNDGIWKAFYRKNDTENYTTFYTIGSALKPIIVRYQFFHTLNLYMCKVRLTRIGNLDNTESINAVTDINIRTSSKLITTLKGNLSTNEWEISFPIVNAGNTSMIEFVIEGDSSVTLPEGDGWTLAIDLEAMMNSDRYNSDNDVAFIRDINSAFSYYNTEGQLAITTLNRDMFIRPYDLSGDVDLYGVVHIDNEGTQTLETAICPLECSYNREGVALFADYNANSNNMYGTLNCSTAMEAAPYVIYKYPRNHDYDMEEKGMPLKDLSRVILPASEVQFSHNDIPNLHLLGYHLFLDGRLTNDEILPTRLKIEYERIIEHSKSTIPNKDEYDNEISEGTLIGGGYLKYTAVLVSTDISIFFKNDPNPIRCIDTSYSLIRDTPICDVTRLIYTFENIYNDHSAIVGIQPVFTDRYYQIGSTAVVTKDNIPVSTIDVGRIFKDRDIVPVGTEVLIPLINTGEVIIPNPYFSKYIEIQPTNSYVYNFKPGTWSMKTSAPVLVKYVTPRQICLLVQEGVLGVKIRRLW